MHVLLVFNKKLIQQQDCFQILGQPVTRNLISRQINLIPGKIVGSNGHFMAVVMVFLIYPVNWIKR